MADIGNQAHQGAEKVPQPGLTSQNLALLAIKDHDYRPNDAQSLAQSPLGEFLLNIEKSTAEGVTDSRTNNNVFDSLKDTAFRDTINEEIEKNSGLVDDLTQLYAQDPSGFNTLWEGLKEYPQLTGAIVSNFKQLASQAPATPENITTELHQSQACAIIERFPDDMMNESQTTFFQAKLADSLSSLEESSSPLYDTLTDNIGNSDFAQKIADTMMSGINALSINLELDMAEAAKIFVEDLEQTPYAFDATTPASDGTRMRTGASLSGKLQGAKPEPPKETKPTSKPLKSGASLGSGFSQNTTSMQDGGSLIPEDFKRRQEAGGATPNEDWVAEGDIKSSIGLKSHFTNANDLTVVEPSAGPEAQQPDVSLAVQEPTLKSDDLKIDYSVFRP
jgi:hypothetical protein